MNEYHAQASFFCHRDAESLRENDKKLCVSVSLRQD
jgi:hypothetical protein